MFFHEDWFMRQIEMLLSAIIQKITKSGESQETELDATIRRETERLLREKDVCGAENHLFAQAEENAGNPVFLKIALDFYSEANKMSDEELEAHNFSRDEIYDGIKEICRICGVDDASFYVI